MEQLKCSVTGNPCETRSLVLHPCMCANCQKAIHAVDKQAHFDQVEKEQVKPQDVGMIDLFEDEG